VTPLSSCSCPGEHEDHKFFVIIQNNVIVRVDICIWRYNFTNEEVLARAESAFCYLFCLSVVDHTSVSLDEIMYLISETVGNDLDSVQPYVERLLEVWELLGNMSLTAGKFRNMGVRNNPGGSVMDAQEFDIEERSVRAAAVGLPAPASAAAIPRSMMMTPNPAMLMAPNGHAPSARDQPIYIGNARMFH
jgi:hypothetical protein